MEYKREENNQSEKAISNQEKYVFDIDLLAPCGLYCGVCPQFIRTPKPTCYGCNSNRGFAKAERMMCGILRCCSKQDIRRCNECNSFGECQRIESFIQWDSFISHAIAKENLNKLNESGEGGFIEYIKESVEERRYPPKPNPWRIRPKYIWTFFKPPYKPEL